MKRRIFDEHWNEFMNNVKSYLSDCEINNGNRKEIILKNYDKSKIIVKDFIDYLEQNKII